MSDTLKTTPSLESWRPVTLGIGSSLAMSKRSRDFQTTKSAESLPRTVNGSHPCKSATSPRQPQRRLRYRSRSVVNTSTSQWKLPPYSAIANNSQGRDSAEVKPSDQTTSLPPAAGLTKTSLSLDCIAALRVLPVRRELTTPYVPLHTGDIDGQIRELVEQLGCFSFGEHSNSFKPTLLKRQQSSRLRADNRFLLYVEDLMRKRYFKALDAQTASEQDELDSQASDELREDQVLPQLVSIDLNQSHSSTAPNGAYSGAELLNYGADNRKSSSETRNSSSPDDGNDSNANNSHNRRRRDNRPSSRNKRRNVPVNSLIPLERSADSELPSVLDENITGTRLNPPSQHHKASRVTGRPAVLKPINSNDQLIAPSQPPKHKNPLSISGLAKPESNAEDVGGAGWTQTQNTKVPTVTRPPIITSQHQANNNNSNSATSSSTSSSAQKAESNGALSTLTVTASSSNTYSIPRRPSKQLTNSQYSPSNNSKHAAGKKQVASAIDADTKYADPIAGASPSFQARLSELASLEAETVRHERLKRLKKKSKDKED